MWGAVGLGGFTALSAAGNRKCFHPPKVAKGDRELLVRSGQHLSPSMAWSRGSSCQGGGEGAVVEPKKRLGGAGTIMFVALIFI